MAGVQHTAVQQVLMSDTLRQRQPQLQSTLQFPLQDVHIVTRSVNYLQQRFPGAKAHTGQHLLCIDNACGKNILTVSHVDGDGTSLPAEQTALHSDALDELAPADNNPACPVLPQDSCCPRHHFKLQLT